MLRKLLGIVFLFVLILAGLAFYFYRQFKEPVIEVTKRFDVDKVTDSTCNVNLYVHIVNENKISFTSKNLYGTLGDGIYANFQDQLIQIPASSDSVYKVSGHIDFINIDHLVTSAANNSRNKPRSISVECKVGYIPKYFTITKDLTDTSMNIPVTLLGMMITKNIAVSQLTLPTGLSADPSLLRMGFRVNNPTSTPFKINNYKLLLKDPKDSTTIVGTVEGNSITEIPPHSEQLLESGLKLNQAPNFFQGLSELITNKVFLIEFTGSASINGRNYQLAHSFKHTLNQAP